MSFFKIVLFSGPWCSPISPNAVETEVLVWDLTAEAPKPAAEQTSLAESFDEARRPENERLMGDTVWRGRSEAS